MSSKNPRTHPFKLARDVQANLNESNFLRSPLVGIVH